MLTGLDIILDTQLSTPTTSCIALILHAIAPTTWGPGVEKSMWKPQQTNSQLYSPDVADSPTGDGFPYRSCHRHTFSIEWCGQVSSIECLLT